MPASLQFTFDKMGNRIRQQGRVLQSHTDGSVTQDSYDHWSVYDAMNRQTAVDAIDAQGHISQTQGHQLGYDLNGNRVSARTAQRAASVSDGRRVTLTNRIAVSSQSR